jgi:hypothetical protein
MLAMTPLAGPLIILLVAGCAATGEQASPGAAATAKPPDAVVARERPVAPRPAETVVAKEEVVVAKPEARPAPPVAEPPAPPRNAGAGTPPAGTPPKAVASAEPARRKEPAPPVTPPAAKAAPPPPVAKPGPPPLDLAALEKRLRETSAIGVFTKLTLKNQVDELLGRFRAHYEGRVQTTLAQLRQPYDTLILKVLSLLQDSDPSLAKAIADSREAIWGILSDPVRFRSL